MEGRLATPPPPSRRSTATASATWTFEPTPRISSYITALIAGPYESTFSELTSSSGRVIPLGVYGRKSLWQHLDADYIFDKTREGFAYFEEKFDYAVPVREVRPALRARVQRGRDGERRRRHLHRDVRLPQQGDGCRQGAPRRHDPARARPHVVRRPRHDEVVERPLAERVVRRVGVDDRHRRGHRVDRGVDDVQRDGEDLGVPPGPAPLDAPRRRRDQRPRGRAGQLRRHHLRQGRLGAQAARRLGRHRRSSSPASARTSRSTSGRTPSSATCSPSSRPRAAASSATWSKKWLETAGVNTLSPEIATDADGDDHPVRDRADRARGLPDDPPAPPRRRLLQRSRATPSCACTTSSSTSTATSPRCPSSRAQRSPTSCCSTTTTSPTRRSASTRARCRPRSSTSRKISDPLARSLVWGAAWDQTRDAEASADRLHRPRAAQHRHRDRVDDGAHDARAAAARRELLRRTREARCDAREKVADALWQLAQAAEAGSDSQLQFVTAFASAASTPAQWEQVRQRARR